MKSFISSSCGVVRNITKTQNINCSLLNSLSTTPRLFSTSACNFEQQQQVSEEVARGRLFFITLVKSPFHQTEDVQDSIKVLKLKKVHQIQVHKDSPQIRGLIYKCRLLLSVKSVSTAELFPEGTQHLPQHVRLTMKEKHELKLKAMREKKSMKSLIEEYIAAKSAQQ